MARARWCTLRCSRSESLDVRAQCGTGLLAGSYLVAPAGALLGGRGWAGAATPPPGRPGRRGALAGVSDAGRCPAALGRPMGVSESRLSGGLVAAHGRWWSQTGPALPGIAGADPSHLVVAGPGPAPGPQVPKPPRCFPGAAKRRGHIPKTTASMSSRTGLVPSTTA